MQRNPQASSKHPSPESEAAEQKALLTVQYSLLKILSKSLAALRHFTPDVCQILLDQVEKEERCCSLKGFVSSISVMSWVRVVRHGLSCWSHRPPTRLSAVLHEAGRQDTGMGLC